MKSSSVTGVKKTGLMRDDMYVAEADILNQYTRISVMKEKLSDQLTFANLKNTSLNWPHAWCSICLFEGKHSNKWSPSLPNHSEVIQEVNAHTPSSHMYRILTQSHSQVILLHLQDFDITTFTQNIHIPCHLAAEANHHESSFCTWWSKATTFMPILHTAMASLCSWIQILKIIFSHSQIWSFQIDAEFIASNHLRNHHVWSVLLEPNTDEKQCLNRKILEVAIFTPKFHTASFIRLGCWCQSCTSDLLAHVGLRSYQLETKLADRPENIMLLESITQKHYTQTGTSWLIRHWHQLFKSLSRKAVLPELTMHLLRCRSVRCSGYE